MSISHKFRKPPFTFMASRETAQARLTPAYVEEAVREYHRKLEAAISDPAYDAGGSVNALVYGEWGHGKSQVLYKTAEFLETRPDVLTLALVPEQLTPRDVLRAALGCATRATQPWNSTALQDGLGALAGMSNEDRNCEEIAAQALARLSTDLGKRHTVLLVDEAQTGPRWFEGFISALDREFRRARVVLHLMQCHSLKTIAIARDVAEKLGDWLKKAHQIQLPAIQMHDAFEFFRQRIASCSDEPDLADSLVPVSIAKTLCETFGGHPRKMLQLAESLLQHCDLNGLERFTGEALVEVFQSTRDDTTGQLLFGREKLQRVLDILPQQAGPVGRKTAEYLKRSIGALFGERQLVSPMDLSNVLGVAGYELPELTKPVDGVPLFDVTTDELDEKLYAISSEFRKHLSPMCAEAGGQDIRRLQVDLIVKPEGLQTKVADGIAQLLQKSVRSVPKAVILGEATVGASDRKVPLRGYQFLVGIEGTGADVSVLVTGLCNMPVPAEMVGRILEKLQEGEFSKAYILMYASESWQTVKTREEFTRVLERYGPLESRIASVEYGDWYRWGGEEADTSQVAVAVNFFSKIVGYGASAGSDRASEEAVEFARTFAGEVSKLWPSKAEVCYLPDNSELQLLSHPTLWGDTRNPRLLSLEEIGSGGRQLRGKDLERLLENYLEKVGRQFRRRPDQDWRLCKPLLDILAGRKNKEISVDTLCDQLRAQVMTIGSRKRLEELVAYLCERLCEAGLAERVGTSYRHKDLQEELTKKKDDFKAKREQLKLKCEKLRRYRDSDAQEFEERSKQLQQQLLNKQKVFKAEPKAYLRELELLQQELSHLDVDVDAALGKMHDRRDEIVTQLDEEFRELRSCRDALPEEWRELLLKERLLDQVGKGIAELKTIEDSQIDNQAAHLDQQRSELQSKISRAKEQVQGKAAGDDFKTQLRNLVASGKPFKRVRVTVEAK